MELEKTKGAKLVHVVTGGLWWDKVNGNTYNTAKVLTIAEDGRHWVNYTQFCYGYGSAYMQEAKALIDGLWPEACHVIIDNGAFYMRKVKAKNGQF